MSINDERNWRLIMASDLMPRRLIVWWKFCVGDLIGFTATAGLAILVSWRPLTKLVSGI